MPYDAASNAVINHCDCAGGNYLAIANDVTRSGAYMAHGFENLVLSHMPARIMKLLMIVGFPSDHDEGIKYLRMCTDEYKDTHKQKITCFLVNFYSFYLEQFFGELIALSPNNYQQFHACCRTRKRRH